MRPGDVLKVASDWMKSASVNVPNAQVIAGILGSTAETAGLVAEGAEEGETSVVGLGVILGGGIVVVEVDEDQSLIGFALPFNVFNVFEL